MHPPPGAPRRDSPWSLPSLRVLAFSPARTREDWLTTEIARLDVMLQVERNVANVVEALVEDPPPRPAVLVVDFDGITGAQLLELHAIRDRGWTGVVVGVGLVPFPLRKSLGIERVLEMPASDGALAELIESVDFTGQTVRIPLTRDLTEITAFRARSLNVRVATKRR